MGQNVGAPFSTLSQIKSQIRLAIEDRPVQTEIKLPILVDRFEEIRNLVKHAAHYGYNLFFDPVNGAHTLKLTKIFKPKARSQRELQAEQEVLERKWRNKRLN